MMKTTRALIFGAIGLIIAYLLISYNAHRPWLKPDSPTLESAQQLAGEHTFRSDASGGRTSMLSRLSFRVSGVDCAKLFSGDVTEKSKDWAALAASEKYNIDLYGLVEQARSVPEYCEHFITERRYITEPLSQEEASFPIAYSILVYKNVELFERLLRSIYRPHNYYCIHVDESSDQIVHDAVRAIVKCFSNVFIPSRIIDVVYSQYTTLEADLLCMRELLAYKRWKYFINLTGQEFPLQSTLAIVKILKAFNGSNSIEGTMKRIDSTRFNHVIHLLTVNVTLSKGAVHIVASRGFVDYATNDKTALKFLDWVKGTVIPDETYFSTLNHNPQLGVPGAYIGEPETFTSDYPFIARFKNWIGGAPNSYPCAGRQERTICIFGIGDLPQLIARPELFANKFHIDHEPSAYACMEELLANRTIDELNGVHVFNESWYKKLSFVKHHI